MQGEKNVAPEEKKPKEVAAAKKTKDKNPSIFFKYHFVCQTMENGAGNCSRSSGGGQRPQGGEKGGQRLQGAADILKP